MLHRSVFRLTERRTDRVRQVETASQRGKLGLEELAAVREAGSGAIVHPPEEVCSREALRTKGHQPRILLTNAKQLEVLLTRQKDIELFDDVRLDFLVVDEAHTFTGAEGAEVACLVRRLRSYCGRSPGQTVCVATPAMIVDENDPEAARAFATRFFGVPRTAVATVRERYEDEVWGSSRRTPQPPTDPAAFLEAVRLAVDAASPGEAVRHALLEHAGVELGGPAAGDWEAALHAELSRSELVYQASVLLDKPRALSDLVRDLTDRVGRRAGDGWPRRQRGLWYYALIAVQAIDNEKRRMRARETNVLAYAQLMSREVLRTGDLCAPLGLSPKQERELLSRMARSGMLVRLKRGVYLVPLKVPPGGTFAPETSLVLRRLMEVSGARYQVGGPNAFNAHGFDDQIPNLTYVYNDRLSGARTVGGCDLVFIKVAGARLGGTVEPAARDDAGVPMTDIARTLVDAVRDWSRFDTLPRAYRWVRQVVTRDGALAPRLADYVRRYGNVATGRRLGYLLERLDADPTALEKLRGYVGAAKSVIPWIPRRRASGPISPWGVIVNGEVPDA